MMDPTTDAKNLWLLYNGNSEMGSDEKAAWDNIMRNVYGITNPTNSINAALDSLGRTVENKDIKLRTNFQFALNQRAKAIVVSSDPHFTRHLQRIIRIAGTQRFAGIIMCYPLMEYDEEARDAGMGATNYFASGPRLTAVYSDLGALVADWIKGTPPSQRFSRASIDHS